MSIFLLVQQRKYLALILKLDTVQSIFNIVIPALKT